MKHLIVAALLCAVPLASGQVFISEVLINPPGDALDDTREFIELQGTPGMKLDGFAIAFLNGTQARFYPLGSIPPKPVAQEVDELFSLDGLELGPNGILVIGVGTSNFYSTLLPDTNFQQWTNLWNGGLDTVGKLENDGSNTVVLIRNRPGRTQADPSNPAGLRWGKDIVIDDEVITPVIDPQTGQMVDQYGDGNVDRGEPDNIGGTTLDLKGVSTVEVSDDLEVVDEVSYEHDRGWEYDFDGRSVDIGSTEGGLPERNVHALDDPQGINPDVLIRVDYRTKGDGWLPAAGAVGELPNGNNWQDTATEQWIRGESVIGSGGVGNPPQIFLSNLANTNPDAIQPFQTQVPRWLDDGTGPDFDFLTVNSYQVMAGRVNPLAVPFIPGDSDRDGDCDGDDIAKIAAVFGDADWVFSNSYATAPEGDSGNPAMQTRPWDVNATGDNGIEPSDLQWALNFQGNTNGRVVGRTYDSTTPAAAGVHLNPNTGVQVTFTFDVTVPSGRPLSGLNVGDTVEVQVRAEVTSGANASVGEQNGVMQVVHDALLSTGGVLAHTGTTFAGGLQPTRSTLVAPGVNGGVETVNGYTTAFDKGISGATALYTLTFTAGSTGSTSLTLSPAAAFTISTPAGVKVGHTDNNGNPAGASYPAPLALTVVPGGGCSGDLTGDSQVDFADFSVLSACWGSPCGDLTGDALTDFADFSALSADWGCGL